MATPRSESDAVAAGLARAAERLKAQQAPAAGSDGALTADEALARLRAACDDLREPDFEVRRARTRIAQLAAEAAARRAPLEAA
jgi:hypothetical protein